MANNIKKKDRELKDVDLLLFMILMVGLIPILLASAEFAKIATIDISLPKGARGATTEKKVTSKPEEEPDKLVLTVLLSDSAMTLGAKSGFLPSIWYKEFHKYVSKTTDDVDPWVEYDPEKLDKKTMEYKGLPTNPTSNEPYSIHEREEIYLVAMEDDYKKTKKGWYSVKYNELLTDATGKPLKEIKPGDVVWKLTTNMTPVTIDDVKDPKTGEVTEPEEIITRQKVKIVDPADYVQRDLSAYDLMKSMLVQVRDRYPDAEDRNDLIIAAENQIVYDKIIQIMDVARSSNLSNISIAKLRS